MRDQDEAAGAAALVDSLAEEVSFEADDVLELLESDEPESPEEPESPDADTEPERESVR